MFCFVEKIISYQYLQYFIRFLDFSMAYSIIWKKEDLYYFVIIVFRIYVLFILFLIRFLIGEPDDVVQRGVSWLDGCDWKCDEGDGNHR